MALELPRAMGVGPLASQIVYPRNRMFPSFFSNRTSDTSDLARSDVVDVRFIWRVDTFQTTNPSMWKVDALNNTKG